MCENGGTIGNIIDLTGKKFNHWTALKLVGRTKNGGSLWQCVCDCGTISNVDGRTLRDGASRCCGCIRPYVAPSKTHGGRGDRLYGIWHGIQDRCYNPNNPRYARYGGRGITVCDEWKNSYETFRDWAMSHGYNPTAKKYECTIDRLDNDGPYAPHNCAWRSQVEQCNNRSNNHLIEYNGETHTISEWARITGIQKSTIRNRIVNMGWDVAKALTEQVHTHIRKVNKNGYRQ